MARGSGSGQGGDAGDRQPAARGRVASQGAAGVVERITYQNPENGYTVARLTPEHAAEAGGEVEAARGDDRLVTLVGTLADLTPGEAIVAHGWWRNDPKHGWQFQALDYRTTLPATTQGMRRYLGGGLVKGIGPVNAGRIVDAFGEGTFAVIDASPERLTEVPGIGPVRASQIAASWRGQRHIREARTTSGKALAPPGSTCREQVTCRPRWRAVPAPADLRRVCNNRPSGTTYQIGRGSK